jgi:hypothetical protein
MSANYDSYVQQSQWQAEQNLQDYNNFINLNKHYNPKKEAIRAKILAREREIESSRERKRESEREREIESARERKRESERERENSDKREKSLLYQTIFDDNGNYRPNRFLTTFNKKPIVPTMSRNSNRRNSNRKSNKSKGGRKRKSGRKTKKHPTYY